MIFTASSEFWPKVTNLFQTLERAHRLSPQVGCVYPIEGAGKVRRSLTDASVGRWDRGLQAGTFTTQDAAHLTGTSPLHYLLGLLLPHAALCNRLEQLLNFWSAVNKFMVPELKCWVFFFLVV